jgi:sigma-B regulation protein RsbU (phosphoserine phosphatase)
MDIEKPEWLSQMEIVLEALNEGVIIADESNQILFANSVFVQMTGISREDLIGIKSARFYTCEEWSYLSKQIEIAIRVGHNRYGFVLPRKDGSRLPVIISSRRLDDLNGRKYGVATFTDISEQKQAEEQLRSLNRKLEKRQLEIEQDLALAARVQQSLLPKSLVWGGVRVDTFYHPVYSIGGDFALVSPSHDDHLNLLVCDVSGHGISSALVANRIYTETVGHLRSGVQLADILQKLNHFVIDSIGSTGLLFTLSAVRIDQDGRRMTFAGAGHPPAMVVRPGQEPVLLESGSTVLGAFPDSVDMDATVERMLEPQDRIVLYTDGITDVFDSHGKMLGVDGVQNFVRETSLLPFDKMKQGILDRVAAWRDGVPVDDVSLVLVEVC